MKISSPSHLTDDALVAAIVRLARGEREATAQLIAHLAELDRRRLYLPAGHSSLYAYCRSVLCLSEPEAYSRMTAARAVRRFPRILEMLLDGSLNLTTLRLLSPHLKALNHESLLTSAAGKSKREVQELLARRFPQQDVPASVRKLPVARPATEVVVPSEIAALQACTSSSVGATPARVADDLAVALAKSPVIESSPSVASPASRAHRPLVTPLAPERYQITFTASSETREKLELARDLLRHAIPNGDPAAIMDRALTALLHELARRKFAGTDRPRPGRGKRAPSHYIPATVKRIVWVRDRGRCAFVATNGHRCGERAFVEFHYHDVPYGVGGKPTAANVQLRCRAHNQHEADVYYGRRGVDDHVQEIFSSYRCVTGRTTVSGHSCVLGTQPAHHADGQSTSR